MILFEIVGSGIVNYFMTSNAQCVTAQSFTADTLPSLSLSCCLSVMQQSEFVKYCHSKYKSICFQLQKKQ